VANLQSFTLWQQATIENTHHAHSMFACLRRVCRGFVLHAHPVRGELHIQRNANRKVETLAAKGAAGGKLKGLKPPL